MIDVFRKESAYFFVLKKLILVEVLEEVYR